MGEDHVEKTIPDGFMARLFLLASAFKCFYEDCRNPKHTLTTAKSISIDLLKISFATPRFKIDVKRIELDALTID